MQNTIVPADVCEYKLVRGKEGEGEGEGDEGRQRRTDRETKLQRQGEKWEAIKKCIPTYYK